MFRVLWGGISKLCNAHRLNWMQSFFCVTNTKLAHQRIPNLKSKYTILLFLIYCQGTILYIGQWQLKSWNVFDIVAYWTSILLSIKGYSLIYSSMLWRKVQPILLAVCIGLPAVFSTWQFVMLCVAATQLVSFWAPVNFSQTSIVVDTFGATKWQHISSLKEY